MNFAEFPKETEGWLGDLPDNWSVKALKYVVTYNDEVLPETTDPSYEIEYADVSSVALGRGIQSTERLTFEDAPSRARRVVRSGDTLISTVRTYLRAITSVTQTPENLIASTGFAVLRPGKELVPEFLGHFATANCFVDAVVAQSKGVSYPATNPTDVVRLPIALPPKAKQRAIASFLDEKTAEIDALIGKKRELLELLAEKRATIITNAVTKGLNPDAPMKDSGIDWLGEVPEDWALYRLKHLVNPVNGIQMGPFGGMLTALPDQFTGFKLYGQENTISGDFSKGDRWVEEERYKALRRYSLRSGDLVMTRKGSLGSCRMFPGDALPGIADSDTIRVQVDPSRIKPNFALLLLHDAWYVAEQIAMNKRGAILAGLNTTVVSNLMILLPPIDNQEILIDFIHEQNKYFYDLASRVDHAIRLLQEYRTALITSAVTGKIKVA